MAKRGSTEDWDEVSNGLRPADMLWNSVLVSGALMEYDCYDDHGRVQSFSCRTGIKE